MDYQFYQAPDGAWGGLVAYLFWRNSPVSQQFAASWGILLDCFQEIARCQVLVAEFKDRAEVGRFCSREFYAFWKAYGFRKESAWRSSYRQGFCEREVI